MQPSRSTGGSGGGSAAAGAAAAAGRVGSCSHAAILTEQQLRERTAEIAATLLEVASFASGSNTLTPSPPPPIMVKNLSSSVATTNTTQPLAMSLLSSSVVSQFSSPNTNPLLRVTAVSPPPAYATIFSTIGVGIDGDATEAAVQAVRDAMERGIAMSLRALPEPEGRTKDLQIHIQLGVPTLPHQSAPLQVDTSRLAALVLPSGVPLRQPIQEPQVGGLFVPLSPPSMAAPGANPAGTCVVVACVSVQKAVTANVSARNACPPRPPPSAARSSVGVTKTPAFALSPVASPKSPPVGTPRRVQANALSTSTSLFSTNGYFSDSPPRAAAAAWKDVELSQAPQAVHNFHQLRQPAKNTTSATRRMPPRTNSMELLARISTAMIGQQQLQLPEPKRLSPIASVACQDDDEGEDDDYSTGARSTFKKLSPGKTPKNNLRHFVRHLYRDFSHEVPAHVQTVGTVPDKPIRTPNAAFPLKLHEILSQIERDGQDNIIGWLPHGRSFKIHCQREFVETILPKYFIMTKKSSFLRQLNLYGFNRISDGSYYHETFLRGMKFLSRRMLRQKVNGNGIRAAGNPDEEPALFRFPVCPPVVDTITSTHGTQQQQQQQNISQLFNSNNGGTRVETPCASPAEVNLVIAMAQQRRAEPFKAAVAVVEASPPESANLTVGPKSGPLASFPLKLQRILDMFEAEGRTDILSWLPHGRAFIVRDPDRFVDEVLPVYFNQSKYSSFQRQCHVYNLTRISQGRDKGAYCNGSLQRGRPELSMALQRIRVNGKGKRRPSDPHLEPDLYALPKLPAIEPGTVIEIPMDAPMPYALAAGESSTSGSTSGED